MYSAPRPISTPINGMGSDMIDGSGTINPAALNTPAPVTSTPSTAVAPKSSPRGIKRSRSPEQIGDQPHAGGADEDDQKPRKRVTQAATAPQRTPQLQSQALPPKSNATPTQSSPPKATPTKTVLKALPTVRDHTTDQLNPEGDEYLPREHDEQGEQKVAATGHPLGGREYKCRTFLVPNRGDKLFMLATECARVLNYRDSYLLFNKNRSLYKIIATQPEKDDLIHQEILPYSYRSRQIAIVTAKSMFRQFGSRVISNGRRVRDDYWEAKARKQGFTEEDASGEKRPGAAKARDAAASEAANAASVGLGHSDIIYSNGPLDSHGQPQGPQAGPGGTVPASAGPLPMIHLAPRDYGNIPRPRQEISGPPYIERSQPSSAAELLNQATQTAEYSKAITQQRIFRGKGMEDFWNKPRDIPASASQQPAETNPAVSQSLQSPQLATSGMLAAGQQSVIQQQSSQIMSPPPYSQQHQGNPLSQSPVRGVPQAMRPEQLHHRSSTLSYPQPGGAGQSTYGYQPSHAWGQPPPQPHQSPLSGHHGMPQYSPSAQSHSSHPSQSTHQPPQLHHSQSSGSIHAGMGYQGMGGMSASSYSPMATRGMYQQQSSPSPQQYMQQQQQVQQQQAQQAQQQQTQQQQTQQQPTTATQPAGMQGWAPPQQQPSHHQGWQGY